MDRGEYNVVITAELEFPSDLARVLPVLLSLPGALRPTHFSDEEDIATKRAPITETKQFETFLENNRTIGFFLFAPGILYNILFRRQRLICDAEINGTPTIAKDFLVHMAAARPIFAFACAREERERRNRIVVKQGVNTIESWLGRDTEKYIPGLYWLTVLSADLAERHGVLLSVLMSIALEHIDLGSARHLFRFYNRPEDWQSSSRVVDVCSALPGVFDIDKVRPQLEATKNFLEFNDLARSWR